MDYKGPKFTLNGDIDCEIKHPKFGWIPFTASPVDPVGHGRDIYAAIMAAGGVAPFVAPDAAPRYATAAEASAAMVVWIDRLSGAVLDLYPAAIQGGWVEEEAMAEAYSAGFEDVAQRATLQADADAKGRSMADQAARILENAHLFRTIAKQARTLWLATDAALAAATDPFQYEAILASASAQGAILAATYGLAVPLP
jgi:hypothetical protein